MGSGRFDRKIFFFFYFSGFSIGTLACSFATNYSTLFGARLITGLFGGTINAIILAIVADSIDAPRRGTALGFLMTAFSLAAIFGVPMGIAVSNYIGWNGTFLFL